MPAAAVIPAPIAYIKVVAVKKLVVEFVSRAVGSSSAVLTGVKRDVLPVDLAVGRFRFAGASANARWRSSGGPTQSCRGALH